MSILSVDNISPIGSGTSVTVNSAATLVLTNANSTGVITATSFVGSGANLTGIDVTKIITGNTQVQTIDTGSDGHVKITTEGTERLRITKDGDFYMHGNAPTHTTSTGSIFISPPSGAGNPSRGILMSNTSDTHYVKIEPAVIDGLVINGYSGVAFATGSRTNSTWAERARFDISGRLMIGTTTEGSSSADDLTIATTGTTGITIRSGTSNNGNIEFSDGTSGQDEYRGIVQYGHSNNSMRFYTNATEKVRIDSSGHLLIGTTDSHGSDADDIVVATSGTTGITIRSGTSASGNIYFADGNSGTSLYRGRLSYYHGDDSIFLGTANSARSLKITSDGSTQLESGVLQRRYESTNTAGYRYYTKAERFLAPNGGSGLNFTITGMTQGWASIRFGGYTEGNRVNFRADLAGYNAGNSGVRIYDSNEITNQATAYAGGASCSITVTKNNASYVVNVTQSNPQGSAMAGFYYFESGGYNSVSTLTVA